MLVNSKLLATIVFVIVLASWFAFGGAFFLLKRGNAASDRKREPASLIGFALQIFGIAIVWFVRRPYFTAISQVTAMEILLAIVAVAAAIFSVWLMFAAIRVLGKQWSLTARVLEGHQLITAGPYALVRHPIYTSLFGMILATGLAQSYWLALLAAAVVYLTGTIIRIRSEERLLKEMFGAEYDEFAKRVPALIPRFY
jgi:protein-S-isoprenylcysteine O-methyltransferase Ste14